MIREKRKTRKRKERVKKDTTHSKEMTFSHFSKQSARLAAAQDAISNSATALILLKRGAEVGNLLRYL